MSRTAGSRRPDIPGGTAGPRSWYLVVIAMLATLSLVTAACGSSGKGQTATTTPQPGDASSVDEGTPKDGGALAIGISAETNGWNPATAQWADTGSLVGSTVLEPLATQGKDAGAKPWLADSWFPNETFDQWQIKLHPGIKYQSGENFDAASVKQNLDFYVQGPLSGLALKPMFKRVTALDPLTVQVELNQPWAAFPSSFLQGGSAYMMSPTMLASADQGTSHPIGTGPFIFDSWEPGNTFKVKKNPNYWVKGLPHLDSIEFKVIPDDSARADAVQAGDVNMEYTTRASDADKLAATQTVVKDWSTENVFVMPNTAPEVGGKFNPMSNLHARKALALATDSAAVAASVGDGVETPTSPWGPKNVWGMPDSQNGYVSFDLEAAKKEVAAYVAETGQSSLKFTLAGLPGVDTQKTLQQVQSQWKDAGIDVNIETLEQTAYITKVAFGNYQAAFFRNYGYPDPDQDYYFWSAGTAKGAGNISINFTQYTTPELEQDVTTGRVNGFANARKAAYDDLVKQLNAGFTNIWLYRTPYTFIANKAVRGLNAAREISFGNYQPKTWLGGLWLDQ
jgi:peptide/nickel transport system substrate-binding protein